MYVNQRGHLNKNMSIIQISKKKDICYHLKDLLVECDSYSCIMDNHFATIDFRKNAYKIFKKEVYDANLLYRYIPNVYI